MLKQISCPVCHSEAAIINAVFGVLPGGQCASRRAQNKLPDQPVEMVGDSIKQQRKEYAKSSVQPFASDGTFSEEYYQAYGTKGIKVSEQEVKKRKRVWGGAISPNLDIAKSK